MAPGETPERVGTMPYRAVIMPDEAYQDLRQEDGWDFLQDHMSALTLPCEQCGQDSEKLTPVITPEKRVRAWICDRCDRQEE